MTHSHKVLLVDDDGEVIQGVRLRLHAAGYETLTASDGEAGVLSAIESQPDAIVLDVRMPRMDGLTALATLQERDDTRDIPIVMLSASLVDQKAALSAGARFFLSKPYQGSALVAAVETAIAESDGHKKEQQ